MLSKSQIKLIKSLKQKKYRIQHQFFIAEGVKTISELINSTFELYQLYTTTSVFDDLDVKVQKITEQELKSVSFLTTPNQALAIFRIPKPKEIDASQLIVALDDVRDPGNLGTIIRLCDWYGVKDLVCSTTTVDCYNPKVVQATMGSITRVNVSYIDLETFLSETPNIVYGAFMDGDNVYKASLETKGVLVLGNEANGIAPTIEKLITDKVSIPRFGNLKQTESLNVANATAILLSEFKRRSL